MAETNKHTHTQPVINHGGYRNKSIKCQLTAEWIAQSEMSAGEFPHKKAYWTEEVKVTGVSKEDVAKHLRGK